MGKFYLLTCCHNFLKKEDGDKLLQLAKEDRDKVPHLPKEDDGCLEKQMKSRCKRAKYLCSTRDFEGTVALTANIVLTNRDDPVLIFDMVSSVQLACSLNCVIT